MQSVLAEIQIPENILHSLNENISDFVFEMKLVMAIELFKAGRLTMTQSAELVRLMQDRLYETIRRKRRKRFKLG